MSAITQPTSMLGVIHNPEAEKKLKSTIVEIKGENLEENIAAVTQALEVYFSSLDLDPQLNETSELFFPYRFEDDKACSGYIESHIARTGQAPSLGDIFENWYSALDLVDPHSRYLRVAKYALAAVPDEISLLINQKVGSMCHS